MQKYTKIYKNIQIMTKMHKYYKNIPKSINYYKCGTACQGLTGKLAFVYFCIFLYIFVYCCIFLYIVVLFLNIFVLFLYIFVLFLYYSCHIGFPAHFCIILQFAYFCIIFVLFLYYFCNIFVLFLYYFLGGASRWIFFPASRLTLSILTGCINKTILSDLRIWKS